VLFDEQAGILQRISLHIPEYVMRILVEHVVHDPVYAALQLRFHPI
jgi:hypothetical protein